LSATDNGKSERVGASMPIITFVASAQRLSRGIKDDMKTKIERIMKRESFLIEIPFAGD
jgi:hypothetical protein